MFPPSPVNDITVNLEQILASLLVHLTPHVHHWAFTTVSHKLAESVLELSRAEYGWHFSAIRMSAQQLTDFRLGELAQDMERTMPELWQLLDILLSANRKPGAHATEGDGEDNEMEFGGGDDEGIGRQFKEGGKSDRHSSIINIVCLFFVHSTLLGYLRLEIQKKVVILSIMLHSTNQKCNAFECIVGIFLHSCNTPERVINALSRMGISISLSAIHRAIRSLSHETHRTMQEMGQTLVVAYAYDNFDIDFKTHVPTVENVKDTLTHLTSGCMIKLDGVKQEDLCCSTYLWRQSQLNPMIPAHLRPPNRSFLDILNLHPEPQSHLFASGLTRCQQWMAYKFLADLVKYEPPYFHQFHALLQCPEPIDQIPVKRMNYVPVRAMDINQSKVSGNIQAITELLQQGGIEDASEESDDSIVDISDYVVLFHGDLGTAERVQTLMEHQAIEATPWQCFQFVIFVMGLFHLKMACADAVWCILIEPRQARDDPTSLMHFVSLNRP